MSDYGVWHECVGPDYEQDPDDTLDYPFEWAPKLDGDTISTSTFLLPDGGSQASASNTDTTATIFLSAVPCGKVIRVTNRITTAGGRTKDWTIRVYGREQ